MNQKKCAQSSPDISDKHMDFLNCPTKGFMLCSIIIKCPMPNLQCLVSLKNCRKTYCSSKHGCNFRRNSFLSLLTFLQERNYWNSEDRLFHQFFIGPLFAQCVTLQLLHKSFQTRWISITLHYASMLY